MTPKESLDALAKVVKGVRIGGCYIFLRSDHEVQRAIELCQLAGARTEDIDKTIESAYFDNWPEG